jgi:hypothetical protein
MHPNVPFIVTVWALVVVGGVALGSFFYIAYQVRDDDDPVNFAVLLAIGLGGSGLVVLGLGGLGFPVAALWTWRLSGIILVGVYIAMILRRRLPAPARLMALANVVVAGSFTAAAFATPTVVLPLQQAAPAASATTTITRVVVDGVQLWHGVALGILAVGTVVFLALFVLMLQRGVSARFESHWGGIGGGVGGWWMSPSLTYLVAAAVFGVLFAILVLQLERRAASSSSGPAPARPAGSPAPAAPPAS